MSDFDDLVMPDTDPETDPEPTTPEQPEPTPEPEPFWKQAGYESEEEAAKVLANIQAERKRINDEKSELGRMKKQMSQEKPVEPEVDEDGDLWDDLDPKVAKKLRAAIAKEAENIVKTTVGPQAEVAAELFNDSAEKAMNGFAKENGLEADELYSFMQSNDLLPSKPSLSLLEKQMQLAANAMKGSTVESLIEQRVAEEMEKLKKDGAYVKAVEPAPTKEPSEKDANDVEPTNFLGMLKKVGKGQL